MRVYVGGVEYHAQYWPDDLLAPDRGIQPGWYIDGVKVSEDEFRRRIEAAIAAHEDAKAHESAN